MKYKVKQSQAGFGLFANKIIKKGDCIIEYTGPILSADEAYAKGGKYLFEISKHKTIDGSLRDNIARYVNHACKPNCEIRIKKEKVFIYALKNIAVDKEITYDYGDEYVDEYIKPYGCRCNRCSLA